MTETEQDHILKLVSGKAERTVQVHLPPVQEEGRPVLLALHGRLGTGHLFRRQSGLDGIADREGFIVLYPDGLWRSWADGRGLTRADREGVDDAAFLEEVLNWAGRFFDADLGRVLLAGHSNGGFMALHLAFQSPELISGVAVVAGTLTSELVKTGAPKISLSTLFVNGSSDPVIPWDGGLQPGGVRLLPVEEAFGIWAQRMGCSRETPAEEGENACGLPVFRRIRCDCDRGARVGLLRVEGGGHEWPAVWGGKGAMTPEQSAAAGRALSEEIWRFFQT